MRASKQGVSGINVSGIEPAQRRNRTGISLGKDRVSDAKCKEAKPESKPYKLSDGGGLFLLVKPNGTKLWQWPYQHGGKSNTFSCGEYPNVGVAEARVTRDTARKWLKAGLDPNIQKAAEKQRVADVQGDTFEKLTEDWFSKKSREWSKDHAAARRRLLDNDLLPALGAIPCTDLEESPATALAALKRIDGRGAHETAAKARIVGSMICRFGIVESRMRNDPFQHLGGALVRPPVEHRATIPTEEMPALFKAVNAVPAEAVTKSAFYWLLLTVARTSEMRFATWSEIQGTRWRITAERMKMREPHVVPLSKQAQRVLESVRELRAGDNPEDLLFPGFAKHGALSENALLALLARAGFYGRQTGHGFRAMFSTWAHEEHEADPDVIEACLAHVKEGVRGVYNRSTYLSKRLPLLQAWADQCSAWGMKL